MRAGSGIHPTRTTGILACSNLTYAVSQTMVIPALPQIQADFGSTTSSTAWVMSSFFISSAIFTGIIGRLGDMFGKRRMLFVTLTAYGGGALLSAGSQSLVVLVIGRVVMGAGGGMVPLAYAIARDELPRGRVSKAIGTIAMTIGLGAGIGMLLGGVLVDRASWHASFVLAAALMVTSMALTWAFVPESPIRSPARVDWAGAGLLATGLGCLLLAISRASFWGWGDPRTLLLIAVGLAVLALLLRVERGRAHPLLHVPTLLTRPVLFTNVASMMMGSGQVAVSILVVQLAQIPVARGGLGSSAAQAGLLIVPYSLTMVLGAQVAGRSAGRLGGRAVLATGSAIASLGLVGLALLPVTHLSLWLLAAVSGLGISMTLVAAPFLLAGSVDRVRTGEANGLNAIARAIGQSIGTQLSATVITAAAVGTGQFATSGGYAAAFAVGAVACGVGLVSSLTISAVRRSVEVAPGVDADGLARRALATSEGDDLVCDILPAGGASK